MAQKDPEEAFRMPRWVAMEPKTTPSHDPEAPKPRKVSTPRGTVKKFTEQTRNTILKRLRTGAPLAVVCRSAGVTTQAISLWREQAGRIDPETDDLYPEYEEQRKFIEELDIARADGEMGVLVDWRKLGQDRKVSYRTASGEQAEQVLAGNAVAIRSFAERVLGGDYAPKPRQLQHTGPGGGPVLLELGAKEIEQLPIERVEYILEVGGILVDSGEPEEDEDGDQVGAEGPEGEEADPPDPGGPGPSGE